MPGLIARYDIQDGDIVVVAQKVVSKSEGRIAILDQVEVSDRARELAVVTGKDPRVVELVLRESSAIVRLKPGLMIVEHRLGFVMANAGIDASNTGGADRVVLLPEDPDGSARRIQSEMQRRLDIGVGVIITDSWGRPWRLGTAGFAIGLAGLPAIVDKRGHPDLDGRVLEATSIGLGDELAAAASVLMGQADEGCPVVVVRGLDVAANDDVSSAHDLIRPVDEDLFRDGGDAE